GVAQNLEGGNDIHPPGPGVKAAAVNQNRRRKRSRSVRNVQVQKQGPIVGTGELDIVLVQGSQKPRKEPEATRQNRCKQTICSHYEPDSIRCCIAATYVRQIRWSE